MDYYGLSEAFLKVSGVSTIVLMVYCMVIRNSMHRMERERGERNKAKAEVMNGSFDRECHRISQTGLW